MKISLITVVRNGELFLQNCFKSVIEQNYPQIEYIVVDGNSTDQTMDIIEQHKKHIDIIISEGDKGLYDAINKGISLASGEIVGLLNSDDMLADPTIIAEVAMLFKKNEGLQGVYGDLNYIHPDSGKIVRKWQSKQADRIDLIKGWMPAHPTLYLRRALFSKYGNYALDLGTAADYDLMLRYFYVHNLKMQYLPKLMVNMRTGGLSNGTLKALIMAVKHDLAALGRNKVPMPMIALLKKKLFKIKQFFV